MRAASESRPAVLPVLAALSHAAGLRRFLIGGLLWLPVSVIPLGSGLILKALFDRIGRDDLGGVSWAVWLCAVFVAVEVVRGAIMWVAWTYGVYWWNAAVAVLRANVMRAMLAGRTRQAPDSSGEAVSRLRDDVEDLAQLTDNIVPTVGAAFFSLGALAVMTSIHPGITLALVVPLIAVGVLSRSLREVVRRLHSRARELSAAVTSHVGDVFSGILTVKSAGVEDDVLNRLRRLNHGRRDAAVRDRFMTSALDAVTIAAIEVSVGLVLLLAAPAMRRGEFTLGDFAVFTTYISWLTALPRVIGASLYRLPQAGVAVDRLVRLMGPGEQAADLARPTGVWFVGEPPPASGAPAVEPLRVLDARGLTVRFPGSGRGVRDVDLRITARSCTVVTGAVGSGKTTLLRALLGLVPLDAGVISWNGRRIDDPAAVMVPARVAYAAQVPRLFSSSLRENVLLGWAADDEKVQQALKQAVFEADIAAMPDGLDTAIGPRGTRLSGGQAQRLTAARALVRDPELLVVDDLSSALDVETERSLWERNAGRTLLVVSHRRVVLERADEIVVLEDGGVAGRGKLDDLLANCPEMRRLWTQDLEEV